MHGEDEERKRTALEKLAAVGSRRTLLTCGNGMGSVVLKHRIALLGCLAFVHLDRGMMVSRVDCSDQRSRLVGCRNLLQVKRQSEKGAYSTRLAAINVLVRMRVAA